MKPAGSIAGAAAAGRPSSNLGRRRLVAKMFRAVCATLTLSGVVLLGLLLYHVGHEGLSRLSWSFLDSFPSRFPDKAGIKSALWGSIWLLGLTALFSVPVGVAAAVYLEEYAKKGRIATFIEINISNLAGVPSIVYGILGLAVFVRFMALDRSVIAGALTMSLLILPTIIIAAREAIRAVPNSLRMAAYALGATRWQTVRHHVLPASIPGIATGVILALSRAMGETAPIIMIGALTYIAFVPESPADPFTALPIQVFNWASRPQAEFMELAASGIIVLLAVLLTMNTAAVLIRNRFERLVRW